MEALNGFLNGVMKVAPVTGDIAYTSFEPATVAAQTPQVLSLQAIQGAGIGGAAAASNVFSGLQHVAARVADTAKDIFRG